MTATSVHHQSASGDGIEIEKSLRPPIGAKSGHKTILPAGLRVKSKWPMVERAKHSANETNRSMPAWRAHSSPLDDDIVS